MFNRVAHFLPFLWIMALGLCRAESIEIQPLRVELGLTDGSKLIGIPALSSVPFQTTYAKMDIPIDKIKTITIQADHENATVLLVNGDNLKGVLSLPPVRLETTFGKLTVGIEHIKTLYVRHAVVAPVANGLISYYPLDQDFNDCVGKNDGMNKGARQMASGVINGAFQLGFPDSVVIPASPSLAVTGEITISMWVNIHQKNRGAWSGFLAYGEGRDINKAGYVLGCDDEYHLVFRCGAGDFYGSAYLPRDVWLHIVARYETGGKLTIFMNGQIYGSASLPGGLGIPRPPWDTITFNRLSDPFAPAAFDIDETMIFNRGLSLSEVSLLFTAGRPSAR